MTVPPRRPMFYDPDGNPIDMWGFERLWGDPAVRFVAQEHVGPYFVSTVWLGVNYNFTWGPPLIFETMVFGESGEDPLSVSGTFDQLPLDQDTYRYATREAAERGHRDMVALVRAELDVTSAEDHVGDDRE